MQLSLINNLGKGKKIYAYPVFCGYHAQQGRNVPIVIAIGQNKNNAYKNVDSKKNA